MRRVAVYAGTRNIYHNMTVAAKSLLRNTRMDRVFFLIEDDEFPEELPDVIRCINVSGQKWFKPDGPNTKKRWTYMAMMRLALHELLPDEERVLWLDVDTIVRKDIGKLFDTDMDGCYVAAAEEPIRSKKPFMYFNSGVMLMDLDKLRDGKAQELIDLVNTREMDFPDQDAINIRCQGLIRQIDPCFNSNIWIVEVDNPAIVHFAADRHYEQKPLWRENEKTDWRVI